MLWTPELTKGEFLAKVDELFRDVKVHSVAVRRRKQQFRVASDKEYEMVKEDLLKMLEEPSPDNLEVSAVVHWEYTHATEAFYSDYAGTQKHPITSRSRVCLR